MSENKVNNLLGVSMDKIKEMVDVNTVIGDPITAPMCAFCRLSRMFRLSIVLWRVCRM